MSVPRISLFINQQNELTITRVRREGEDDQVVVEIPLEEVLAPDEDSAAQKLGISLLRHLAVLYPGKLNVSKGAQPRQN